ncbi:MAG: STAS domain-containing protein [Defluviitaleaceae bacterium]|nr:STAS domain-containing protein [Defluviitaleaceae bacterium]
MTINTTMEEGRAIVAVTGRLETRTSDLLAKELTPIWDEGNCDITLDFEGLQFISSAGLRVLFIAHKKLKPHNKTLTVINANESIKEIFAITGYTSL